MQGTRLFASADGSTHLAFSADAFRNLEMKKPAGDEEFGLDGSGQGRVLLGLLSKFT